MLDQATAIRTGEELNRENLNAYLKETITGFSEISESKQFPKGYSNLTYLILTNNKSYVLRRPPFGANIKSAHDMGREYKVLSLLKDVYKKVPEPLVYCEDKVVIGAPFYVMERVEGVILRDKLPQGVNMTPADMQKLSEATIDNLVDLHAIDVINTDLIHMGKPEGYVKRQIEGWIKRYYNAETESIEHMDQIARWMPDNLPAEIAPAFIHNDYKYDNLILNPDDFSDIIAVLDWEMATVGDPLMDLATTLGYWAEESDHPALTGFSLTSQPGNLNREEVLQRYAAKSGRDVANFKFYYVYACFKIGVICQQIYARYKKGLTKDPRFAGLIHLVKGCAMNGSFALSKGRIGNLY